MDIKDYYGKTMLGWIYYNENYAHGENGNYINRVCYIYPRYILEEDGEVISIDPNDFPTLGSFEVRIQGGFSAEEVVEKLTHLVKVKFNIIPEEDLEQQNNHYRLKFNPTYDQEISEVWMEKFNDNRFYQVISTDLSIDEIIKRQAIDCYVEDIFTKYIVLKNKEGFFGPFDYSFEDDIIKLQAVSLFDYHVLKPNPAVISKEMMRVGDRVDNGVNLVRSDFLDLNSDIKDSYDFITDDILLDMIINIFEERNTLDRSQVKDLRKLLFSQINPEVYPKITDKRLARLKEYIRRTEYQDEFLSKIAYFLMEDENNKDYVLRQVLNTRFEELEERSTKFIEVRERLEELTRKKEEVQSELDMLNNELVDSKSFIIKENEALSNELNKQIEALKDKKSELEKNVENLLVTNELSHLNSELDAAIDTKKQELVSLEKTKSDILKELNNGIADFKNETKLIGRALVDKGFDDIINTAKGNTNFYYPDKEPVVYADFSSKEEIVDYIYTKMNTVYNHRMTRNEVVNMLVLFSNNFITNIAGKNGSGKTATAVKFANALGLNFEAQNLVKIAVDLDIRSIKDLIGYYNPNNGEIVKSNWRLFDMLESKNELCCLILDGINSSIPEHFMASLIGKDVDTCEAISLGGGKDIFAGKEFRILTTINDDNSGFILTNRYFDNTATMYSDYDGRSAYRLNNEEFEDKGAIRYSDLMRFRERVGISNEYESKFNSLISIFKKSGQYISSRAIEKSICYMESSTDLMDLNCPNKKYLPIELAVLQFIVPTLDPEIMGERFVSMLANEIKTMPLLEEKLSEFKSKSKDNIFNEFNLD